MTESTKSTLALVAVTLLSASVVCFANWRDSEAEKNYQPRAEAKAKVEALRKDFEAGRIEQGEYMALYQAAVNSLPAELRAGGL